MASRVSVLIGTRNRPDLLRRCLQSIASQDYSNLEIIVLDDASDDPELCKQVVAAVRDPRVRCVRSDTQLGVAPGRNMLMRIAQGEILFVIDDDAYFTDTTTITTLVQCFAERPDVGIVAGKVVDHHAGRERVLAPFSQWARRRWPRIEEKPGLVSYFLGGCHGIRRDALRVAGMYSDGFVFGDEEMDLSIRMLKAGYKIYYHPAVSVAHETQGGDRHFSGNPRHGEIYHLVRNRLFLAYKYLPAAYVPFYILHWIPRAFFRAIRERRIMDFFDGLRDGRTWIAEVQREPVNREVIEYLKRHHGRLWY